jgi:uncharacterized protein (DUF2252 family)
MDSPAPLLTTEQRRDLGHGLREHLPRSAHAVWSAPAERDPVALLLAADVGRLPALLPLRYGRMRADPFAFMRGSAAIMAADLATLPATGLRVQACGDAHIMNYGAYAAPEGTPVFDINDFDETLPAPFEWDLKRLAASLAVAATVKGLEEKPARGLARKAAHSYRRQIDALASQAPLDAWRSRIDLERAIEDIGDRDVRRRERRVLAEAVADSRNAYRHLVAADGKLRLPERPPVVFRLGDQETTAHSAFAAYLDSLAEERRVLVERYRLRDVAFKAVGVGSVGTFCALGLFATADGETLILQLKQAATSVLAPYAGASAYSHAGERVVVGQRMLQASVDVFLGWGQAADGRHFYVRQLKDARLAAVGLHIEGDALRFYAALCGRTLARAHARSGDAARIAGYLGDSDSFDQAISEFAWAYAGQTKADHAAFVAAIAEGRVEAATG